MDDLTLWKTVTILNPLMIPLSSGQKGEEGKVHWEFSSVLELWNKLKNGKLQGER